MPAFLPLAIAGSAIGTGANTIRKYLGTETSGKQTSGSGNGTDRQEDNATELPVWRQNLQTTVQELNELSKDVMTRAKETREEKQRVKQHLSTPLINQLATPEEGVWPHLYGAKKQEPLFLTRSIQKATEGLQNKFGDVAESLDDTYQKFMLERIDPLFGSNRHEQFQILATGDKAIELSSYERELNRDTAVAVLALGAATLGYLAVPALYGLACAMALYLTRIPVSRAYHALVNEKRVKLPVLVTLNLLGMWLGGYFVMGSLGFVIFLLGEKLVIITQDRSHKNLINVFGEQPRTVWVSVDDTEIEIPFEKLRAGDRVIIQAGQTIAVDGIIVEGMATVDQHALTGESQPAEKSVGDRVLTATTVLGGKILVEVEKTGEATVAAQIGDILNNTTGYQMAIESKGLSLAHDLSLPTLALGVLAWPVTSYPAMVAILGSSIGYNIKITGPIAMLNFLNVASENGILIKDGRSLELMYEVDTVVFDKTGTLTLEQPHVVNVHTCGDLDADTILTYAAAAEHRQPHPIARAILEAAAQQGLPLPDIDEARYEVGYGISVQIDNKVIYVGSNRYMTMEGIETPAVIEEIKAGCHADGHSLVMVAVGKQLAGAIELKPTLRPEAKSVITALRNRGVELVIISGDQEQPTRKLAQDLGIDRYFANTLPENKAAHVERLQSEGRSVCFVGDGINDAIALKTANVSISLRGATTAATDTAQVVLMGESLHQLPFLFNLSEEFNANMRRGFTSAIIPGIVTISGAYLGIIGIAGSITVWMASLMMGLGVAAQPLLQDRSAPPEQLTDQTITKEKGKNDN